MNGCREGVVAAVELKRVQEIGALRERCRGNREAYACNRRDHRRYDAERSRVHRSPTPLPSRHLVEVDIA